MNKRIIALITALVLLLCAQGGTVIAAGSQNDKNNNAVNAEYNKAYKLLKGLGVIYEGFEEEETLTRGAFIKMFVGAINMSAYNATANPFSDVSAAHKYKSEISAAYELGYIHGYGDGTFRPDEGITFEECMGLAYKALGIREELAQYSFLFQVGKKLSEGLNSNSADIVSKEQAVRFLYNMMLSDVYGVKIGKNSIAPTGSTYLYEIFKVTEEHGIICANSYVSLDGGEGLGSEYIKIDDKIYTADEEDLSEYNEFLGCSVDYFAKESDDVLVSLTLSSKCKIMNIESFRLEPNCFNGRTLAYRDNEGRKGYSANISGTAAFLVNGMYEGSQIEPSAFDIDFGDITLIDNTGDEVYDVVSIMDYQMLVAGNVVTSGNKRIYDKYSLTDYVDLDEKSGKVKLNIWIDGKRANSDDILTDDCFAYAVSDLKFGKQIVTVKMNRNTVSGRLEAKDDDYITVEGKEYRIAAELKNTPVTRGDEPDIGKTVTVKLDYLGQAAVLINIEEADLNYGFLIGVAEKEGLSSQFIFRLYTTGSAFVNLKCRDKIKINNVRYDNINLIRSELLSSKISKYNSFDDKIYQIVKYKVRDGVLTDIYTTSGAAQVENAPVLSCDFAMRFYKNAGRMFSGSWRDFCAENTDSLVMYIPSPDENGNLDEDKFYMSRADNLVNGDTYNIAAYDSKEYGETDFMLVEYEKPTQYPVAPKNYLCTKVSTVLDDNGDTQRQLRLIYQGGYYTYTTQSYEVGENAKPGDVVNLLLDARNRIVDVRTVKDMSADIILQGFNNVSAKNMVNLNYRNMTGYLEAYRDGIGWITYNAALSDDPSSVPGHGLAQMPSRFVVWNMSRREAEILNSNELVNYISRDGLDYLLFVSETYGTVMDIIVYEM